MIETPTAISKGLLTIDECGSLSAKVLQHRELWDGFNEYPSLPLFTLGSPVYRAESFDHYVSHRAKSDIFLTAYTLKLQRTVIAALETRLSRAAKKLPDSSPFGFHIFNRCHGLRESFYSIRAYHTDHDVLRIYQGAGIRPNSIFSFIVPISIPESGAGLDWRPEPDDDHHLGAQRLEYTLGDCFLWSGDTHHKFSDLTLADDEARITYQGHGFIANDRTFYYYW